MIPIHHLPSLPSSCLSIRHRQMPSVHVRTSADRSGEDLRMLGFAHGQLSCGRSLGCFSPRLELVCGPNVVHKCKPVVGCARIALVADHHRWSVCCSNAARACPWDCERLCWRLCVVERLLCLAQMDRPRMVLSCVLGLTYRVEVCLCLGATSVAVMRRRVRARARRVA